MERPIRTHLEASLQAVYHHDSAINAVNDGRLEESDEHFKAALTEAENHDVHTARIMRDKARRAWLDGHFADAGTLLASSGSLLENASRPLGTKELGDIFDETATTISFMGRLAVVKTLAEHDNAKTPSSPNPRRSPYGDISKAASQHFIDAAKKLSSADSSSNPWYRFMNATHGAVAALDKPKHRDRLSAVWHLIGEAACATADEPGVLAVNKKASLAAVTTLLVAVAPAGVRYAYIKKLAR